MCHKSPKYNKIGWCSTGQYWHGSSERVGWSRTSWVKLWKSHPWSLYPGQIEWNHPLLEACTESSLQKTAENLLDERWRDVGTSIWYCSSPILMQTKCGVFRVSHHSFWVLECDILDIGACACPETCHRIRRTGDLIHMPNLASILVNQTWIKIFRLQISRDALYVHLCSRFSEITGL